MSSFGIETCGRTRLPILLNFKT